MSWKTTLQVIVTVYVGIAQAGVVGVIAYQATASLWSLFWAVPGCLVTSWSITALVDLGRLRS